MTTAGLLTLIQQRNNAWELMDNYGVPIGSLLPEDRRKVEELTTRYHQAERAIVAHLQAVNAPVVVGAIVLHLTSDRQHFIELDRKTQTPVWMCEKGKWGWKGLLYRYPEKKARKSA